MSRFLLSFKAKLQNLTALQAKGGWDSGNEEFVLTVMERKSRFVLKLSINYIAFNFCKCFQVKCSGCERETELDVYITSNLTMTV